MEVEGLGKGSFLPGTSAIANPVPKATPYHIEEVLSKAITTLAEGKNAIA